MITDCKRNRFTKLALALLLPGVLLCRADAAVEGWLNWRGPRQAGVSNESGLPDHVELDGKNYRWTFDLAGRGTPVVAGDRVYAFGYEGEGPDLVEVLVSIDAASGKEVWRLEFGDFLSDIIYKRYSIGSPTVDADTGNIYLMTSPGIFVAVDQAGNILWQHSMMESFGRLTFPNGRTGAPVIDDDLVIVRGITTNWGKEGPARDRFYAFNKLNGKNVWASTPGVAPTDSSFSTPIFSWLDGKRVFYSGTGCGNLVCVNARTGEPLSRFQFLHGGVNGSLLVYGDNTIIAIHGKENLDSSEIGRMAAIRMDAFPAAMESGPVVLPADAELWRNHLGIFTSSPVLVGNRVYQVTHTGELACVDADSGRIMWEKKLSNSQLHASPLYADGKLYVPMRDGVLHILRPDDSGAVELGRVQLEGNCLGAPAVWNGQVYVHTTKKLYCFGSDSGVPRSAVAASSVTSDKRDRPANRKAARLRCVPGELLLRPGAVEQLVVDGLDTDGFATSQLPSGPATWQPYIPAAAKVRTSLNAAVDAHGVVTADSRNVPSAGMFKVDIGELTGFVRGRILPAIPFSENFETFDIGHEHPAEPGVMFAYPPLPWIGARFKWEIRSLDGNKVLAKTLDRLLFQRAMTFIGHPDMANYTMSADVMTDGNRRIMSTVGVVNQRYIIALVGNWQILEISSNHDCVKYSVPFAWQPNTWYRLKTRVDVAADGAGAVRARAWRVGEPEPDDWTVTFDHGRAHRAGAPGLFGFSPQSQKRVYIDNISVVANDRGE